jgi:broad specificity phosphatase PhoE/predicted kinase
MKPLTSGKPVVLVMVGLPARGKTFIARKLARYLQWLGTEARVFNVGNYRREHLGSRQPADFFDPDNAEGYDARRRMAMAALDDVFAWLRPNGPGEVAIYDATNVTRERRDLVHAACVERGIEPIFVESVNNNPDVIATNIQQTKLRMPDYAGMDPDTAVADFRARIAHYESSYEPVDEPERSWVKLINVGDQVILNRIRGYLPSRLVFFLSNLHIVPRPIYLSRHGQSEYNVLGKIGGDSPLSPAGAAYAARLSEFLVRELGSGAKEPRVWTSSLRRTRQTARPLPWTSVPLKHLDEIDAGTCDGLTYAEIAEQFPQEYAARQRDKLHYRYPRGESYQDVIDRLDPVIIELERKRRPVVVIAHQAVLRCLYAYLTGQPREHGPRLDMPLHTVIRLQPSTYGVDEQRFVLDG